MWQPLNPPISDWQRRRVWVIGGSSGIGAALVRALLQRGAAVALSARRAEQLQAVAAADPRAYCLPLNVTQPQAWQAACAELQAQWGWPDLVIFCAADYHPQRCWELTATQVAQTLDVNIAGVYYGLEVLLPAMLQHQQGGIALIASVAGYTGLPGAPVYGPTKAALINLAQLLYCELHRRGLAVYLINPGFVKTALTAKNQFYMPGLQTPEQAAEQIIRGLERGKFEIHFPLRFSYLMKLLACLPVRWRFSVLQRLVTL